MTRRKKIPQSLSDEKLKTRKRARKPETTGAKPAHQVARHLNDGRSGAADPESIKGLQQTVGNQVVARLVAQGAGAGAPAVQREAIIPASEEKEPLAASSSKMMMPGTTPGAPPPVPLPYPNMSPGAQGPLDTSKVAGGSKGPMIGPGSEMGSSAGDEAGTMKDITSLASASNKPGQSSIVIKPSAGIVPFQAPGSGEQEGAQPAQTPAPQPEEQESS